MGLEPTTLCLGRLGLITCSSGLFLNLATHFPPNEADGRQIANRRYYTPIAGQFNAILWPSEIPMAIERKPRRAPAALLKGRA